ncbi:hypothetical protein CLV80_11619 [Yoonia maritima]|uniref:WD40 repeat protein n=1 Tax=Yoonia maritima TaxID=1435347 RepID=A0A2T0VTZ2_9RHOB|nr:hypothetical protein [Yoonia maritima]PRY74637.1 hypothetical protein CLV80_11619 [Yoonia maritima]
MANFSLNLKNPALTKGQLNTIYVGSTTPNAIELEIKNLTAFDVTFKTTETMTLKFPGKMISTTNAANITVDTAWTKTKLTNPNGSADPYYTFSLVPKADIVVKPTEMMTLTLSTIVPTTAVNGSIVVSQSIPFADLQAQHLLICTAVPSTDNQTLMGPNRALEVDATITGATNSLASTNKIEPSVKPASSNIKPESVVLNTVQLSFAFKGQNNRPETHTGYDPLQALIKSFDTGKSPEFTIRFPYANALSNIDPNFALTDNSTKSQGYISPTSGRNIDISLSSNREGVLSTSNWEVTVDVSDDATAPVWHVRPAATNQHVFTSISVSNADPFLNIYLRNICTALPIDPSTPQSVAFIQTKNFPGFNDQFLELTVDKDPVQKTKSFAVSVAPDASAVELDWQTQNTTSVTISSVQHGGQAQLDPSGPLSVPVSVQTPLLCQYDLASYNANRTPQTDPVANAKVNAVWTTNQVVAASGYSHLSTVCSAPDAQSVFAPALGADAQAQLYQFSTATLAETSKTAFADGLIPVNVAANPTNTMVYVVRQDSTGLAQDIVKLDATSLATQSSSIAASANFTNIPHAAMQDGGAIATTPDGSHVVYSSYKNSGTPAIYYIDTSQDWSTYTAPIVSVPALDDRGLAVSAQNIFHSDSGGLGHITLTPSLGTSSTTLALTSGGSSYQAGPMSLSQNGSLLAVWSRPQGKAIGGRIFFVRTSDITVQPVGINTQISYVPPMRSLAIYRPSLCFSADGAYLFVSGVSVRGDGLIYVYDVATGAQIGQPILYQGSGFGPIVAQPDGLAVFAITFPSNQVGGVYRLDPEFAPFVNLI